ncbi:MFS transporter [Pseudomonas vancouverensis]|uniref:MFS transporter n=1 Tax=Pseudomonas vancouverensis TaxID=95300 RepID=A0A1H2N2A3_PSEVA|nr:MFS transporter [Pseudomonas vancouverensis]KAB0495775.1 MFS transporter [Pseudomonas vancouverensis]TDB65577.1 MFS transporter [Pseudomonas vancouverensis]SDU99502.1 Predicted arabinose efflux permease, MFS family [Pseudomonas vancouverensis]
MTADTDSTIQPIVQKTSGLSPALIWLFSVTCGLAVANVYFAQPLLDSIARSLDVAPAMIGVVVTATQVGYAAGLLFIVPLGDLLNRKGLVLTQMLLSALALATVGAATQWSVLLAAMIAVGLLAVVVQVLVAYTAVLATTSQRGRAVGTVTSGVVLGILLARLTSGLIADLAGWRAVYFLSAGLMLALALVFYKALPTVVARRDQVTYPALLGSLFRLFLTEPLLRIRGLLALLIFAAFSVLWTAMVLPLSAPPLSLSHTAIGLFGLAGVAGALAARRAGVWADRGLGQKVTGLSLAILLLSWLPIAFAESSLIALACGVVLLDFAVQAVHVTNQSLIFAARPDAQSRMVGAYMCFYSVGSALGALAATQVYAQWGWLAVSLLGALISAVALLLWWLTLRDSTTAELRAA